MIDDHVNNNYTLRNTATKYCQFPTLPSRHFQWGVSTVRPKLSMGCVFIDLIYQQSSFWYKHLCDTSLYPNLSYGYLYSIKFTFSRPSKANEGRRIAQWVHSISALADLHYFHMQSALRCMVLISFALCRPCGP